MSFFLADGAFRGHFLVLEKKATTDLVQQNFLTEMSVNRNREKLTVDHPENLVTITF